MEIQKIIEKYQETLEQEISKKSQGQGPIISEIYPRLTEFSKKYIEELNHSIIAGEYFENKNLEEQLKNHVEKLENLYNLLLEIIDGNESEDDKEIYNKIFFEYINALKILTESYSKFSIYQRRVLEEKEHHILENFEVIYIETLSNDVTQEWKTLLEINLILADIDSKLIIDVEFNIFERLEKIHQELKRDIWVDYPIIKAILKEKCVFLIKKISEKIDKKNNIKVYNQIYWSGIINEIEKHEYKYYGAFNDKLNINNQYKEEQFEKNGKLEILIFGDVYFSIKKHNRNKNIEKINRLIEKVEKNLKDNNISHFDKRASKINLNYIKNNLLSSLTKKNDKEALLEEFNKIEDVQEETGVSNYYPYYKMIIWFQERIKKKLEDVDANLADIDAEIKFTEDLMVKFQEKLNWSKNTKFLCYQLPFTECIKTVDIGNHISKNVFLHSSFIKPINYDTIIKEKSNVFGNLRRFEMILKFKQELLEAKKTIDDKIDSLDDKIDKSTRKEIEILGIFAALVFFSAGEIQLFSKVSNIHDIVLHSLGLAFGMGLFSILIWLVSRDFKSFKTSKIHNRLIWIFGIGTFAIIGYLIYKSNYKSEHQIKIENYQYQVDSLKLKRQIDSLSKQVLQYKKASL